MLATTRTRAAILCFGGWGLQTMLHLWPRLALAQEVRWNLGIEKHLIDLNQVSAFAGVIPNPQASWAAGQSPPFDLVRPNPQIFPDSFWVEEMVARYGEELWSDRRTMTASEMLTHRLVENAREQRLILPVPWSAKAALPETIQHGSRITRREMFEVGIGNAGAAVRALLRHVLDPTRLDKVQPRDPFVQTSLYIVASLAEPLASVLIWPLVSEIVATLGNRNVAKIVAIFSTGSFASDDTLIVEEAATHCALMELETLTGLRGWTTTSSATAEGEQYLPDYPGLQRRRASAHATHAAADTPSVAALRQLVRRGGGGRGWEARLGSSMFNNIYLLDSEKSNGSKTEHSAELAVTAGNAIESFLIAEGAGHVEMELGPYADGLYDAPYSLLGAASDYVPLADYLRAARLEEQKRLVREKTLQPGADDPELRTPPTLSELEVTPEEAVRRLLEPTPSSVFEPEAAPRRGLARARRRLRSRQEGEVTNAVEQVRTGAGLPIPRVARDYILPDADARALDETGSPWRWLAGFDTRLGEVDTSIESVIETRHFEQAWGLTYYQRASTPEKSEVALSEFRRRTWALRYEDDTRTIPRAVRHVLYRLVEDIVRYPNGLRTARKRLDGWLKQVEPLVGAVPEPESGIVRRARITTYQQRLNEWRLQYLNTVAAIPNPVAAWSRAILLGLLVAFIGSTWLMQPSTLPPTILFVALGAACLALTVLAGVLPGVWSNWQLRRLQDQRLAMEQDRLSDRVQEIVRGSLQRVYLRLYEDLTMVRVPLETAVQDLESWSKPEDPVEIPPPLIEPIHVREAHTSEDIWKDIQRKIQGQATNGQTSDQLYEAEWPHGGEEALRKAMSRWDEQGERLAQRVRLALEVGLNRRELLHAATQLKAQEQVYNRSRSGDLPVTEASTQAEVPEVIRALAGEAWCAFAEDPPNRRDTTRCTACPNAAYGCPFCRSEHERLHEQFVSNDPEVRARLLCVDAQQEETERELAAIIQEFAGEWSISATLRGLARNATDHLIPQRGILPKDRDFIVPIIKDYSIERLLFDPSVSPQENGTARAVQAQRARTDFVEDIYARAKPSVNYDVVRRLSYSGLPVDFAVSADGAGSSLSTGFDQRHISVLSSHDPMSISVTRTVNCLHLDDLILRERCQREFERLNGSDRPWLTIVGGPAISDLYGKPDPDIVEYDPVMQPHHDDWEYESH